MIQVKLHAVIRIALKRQQNIHPDYFTTQKNNLGRKNTIYLCYYEKY
jgi:hypothetical protein